MSIAGMTGPQGTPGSNAEQPPINWLMQPGEGILSRSYQRANWRGDVAFLENDGLHHKGAAYRAVKAVPVAGPEPGTDWDTWELVDFYDTLEIEEPYVKDGDALPHCPRKIEEGFGPGSVFKSGDVEDAYKRSGGFCSCTYCGSIHPDVAMHLIKIGALVVPTDKPYKAFIKAGHLGEQRLDFRHLTQEHRTELVAMINARTINFAEPGNFYVLPFFCSRAKRPGEV